MCTAAGTAGPDWARGHFDWCASQYNPDLDYAVDYSPEYAETVSAAIQGLMGDAEATTSFVIDTGRNGQGPWTPGAAYPDPSSGAMRRAAASGCVPAELAGPSRADRFGPPDSGGPAGDDVLSACRGRCRDA
jgi:endoglucanase